MAKNSPINPGLFFVGNDHALQIGVVDAAGSPQVMTGWALEWVMRTPSTDGAGVALLTKTTGASQIAIISNGGTNNQANVTIARADTLGIPPGKYSYTLWRTDAGFATTLAYGVCTLDHPERQ